MNDTEFRKTNQTFFPTHSEMRIASFAIVGTGTAANSLIVIVIVAGLPKRSVLMMVLFALALVDNLYLWSVIMTYKGIFGNFLFGPSLIACRVYYFIIYTSGMVSSWLVVLVAIERFIAVLHPLKVHIYCTQKRIYLMMIVIAFSSSIYSIHCFFTCAVVHETGVLVCINSGSNSFSDMITLFVSLLLYSIIPLFIIMVLNILTARKMRNQLAFRHASQRFSNHQHSSVNHERSLTVMMITVCTVFGVTSLPATTVLGINYACQVSEARYCIDSDHWIYGLAFLLDQTNHSINLFLYCLTGTVFRTALLNMFKCHTRQNSLRTPDRVSTISVNIL